MSAATRVRRSPASRPDTESAFAAIRANVSELEARVGEAVVTLTRLIAAVAGGEAIDDVADLGDVRASLGSALTDAARIRATTHEAHALLLHRVTSLISMVGASGSAGLTADVLDANASECRNYASPAMKWLSSTAVAPNVVKALLAPETSGSRARGLRSRNVVDIATARKAP